MIAKESYIRRRIFLILSMTFVIFNISLKGQQDSILSLNEVLERVKNFHPFARQADLQNRIADAELLKAKGNFDPIAGSVLDQKEFADKSYYSILDGGVKWATPFGATIKSGYEFNRGLFLNPENSTPSAGLLYAGIALPVGQGLLIDERRATRNSAKIGINLADSKRQDMLNKICYEVTLNYWEWFRSYYVRQIFNEAFANASQRYEAVVINSASGDRPAIDTVEARIQLQLIETGLNQAVLEYRNAGLMFSTFLWNENNENSGLESYERPVQEREAADFRNITDQILNQQNFINSHPYLEQLRLKMKQLEIDQKLKRDKLKPVINLQFNPLTEAVGNNYLSGWSVNNYKFGIEFKMPLLLRKERGDLKLAELKILDNTLELENNTAFLFNSYNAYINEYLALQEQALIFESAVANYQRMFEAESRLFQIGESSLFLVNAREQAFINARIKYLDLLIKCQKAYYSILYYAGLMGNL